MHPARTRRTILQLLAALTLVAASGCGIEEQAPLGATQTVSALRQGDTGPAVARFQRDLRVLGIDVPIDGEFDAAMAAHVRTMQDFFDLPVDGIVGARTRSLLDELRERIPVTLVEIDPSEGVDAVVHASDTEWCFELVAGATGASGCVPRGAPLATRYLVPSGGSPVDAYAIGIVESPAVALVQSHDGGTSERVPAVALDVNGRARAFALPDDAVTGSSLRATDSAGREVVALPLVHDDVADLGLGSIGPAVLRWQHRLVDAGAELPLDGVYGFTTANVVAAIQTYLGHEANGRLDAVTREALGAAAEGDSKSPPARAQP
jgi:peptidoglycan hydrolase-like protein with peptidoglycan-binding domain